MPLSEKSDVELVTEFKAGNAAAFDAIVEDCTTRDSRERIQAGRARAYNGMGMYPEAIAAGVFGVPTFVVDGEVFWGDDATDMLLDYLANRDLFASDEFKWNLSAGKDYDWVFKDTPCTICSSLYKALLHKLGDPAAVFAMIHARPYLFNRRLGEGITVFNPMLQFDLSPTAKVGVIGIGGLGHMGVKFARAFGSHVVVFTTSPDKTEDALRVGAHEVIVSTDAEQMQAIVDVHYPDLDQRLLADALEAFYELRGVPGLRKKPSTSELIDWIAALRRSGVDTTKMGLQVPFLGTLIKKEQDLEVVVIENRFFHRILIHA